MAEEVNMSAGSIEATIHNKLKSRKVNAMRVPKQLFNKEMKQRSQVCTQLPQCFKNCKHFLANETQIHYISESKYVSMK
jgi:hypothetical protein